MKFYIKQKVFSLRDTFSVKDVNGKDIYQVKGKMFSFNNELNLLNLDESLVLKAKKKIISFMAKYTIFDSNGEEIAKVSRKFGLKPKFEIEVGHETLKVEGSFFAYSFGIFNGEAEVATIQKEILTWGDTYSIDIEDETKKELYLFMVILIDQIIHENKSKDRGFDIGSNF